MANRRMFSKSITSSARFIKMPQEVQNLYFHLCMNADDDGIVEAFTIMNMLGSSEDNIKILSAKSFVRVLNADLVTHILDWNEHNTIRADRKVNSVYKDLLIQILPNVKLKNPKPRSDVEDNSKRINGGQSTDGIGYVSVVEGRVGFNKLNHIDEPSVRKSSPLDFSETQIQSVVKQKDPPPLPPPPKFSMDNTIQKMSNGKDHDKLMAVFWSLQGFVFENSKQYQTRYARDVKAARKLADAGYSGRDVMVTMEYCKDKFKDPSMWTLETVEKLIAKVVSVKT